MSGLDASIYQNIRPVEMPSPMDAAQKAMTLSELGMRQRQMTYQMGAQMATRKAIADNTDETGNVNKQGALSQLGKMGWGQQAMDLGQQFASQDKAQAEAQQAKAKAITDTYQVTGPSFDYLAKMPEDQRAQAYSGVIGQLKGQGIDVSKMDHPYTKDSFDQYYGSWQQSKPALEKMLAQSEIAKNNATQMNLGAGDLADYTKAVASPSSRSPMGILAQQRDSADKMLSMLQPRPGENPQQTVARLNAYIPQFGTDVGISLARTMMGSAPDENVLKEVVPSTVQSHIASLKSKFSAQPNAANLGSLLQAYGGIAQGLRTYTVGRMQQEADQIATGYPRATSFFPKHVKRIRDSLAMGIPSSEADPDQGGPLAQGGQGGSGILESSASASERAPKQSPLPDGMVRVKGPDGKIYRIPKSHQGEAIAAGGNLVK